MGDPLATMGGRNVTRAADRARLSRQLGLDKPLYMQYLYWLIGNDWTKVDLDGDGVAETPGRRKGVLRGDFGQSIVERRPVTEVIGDRLPNTLILMIAAEVVIMLGALVLGIYSALHQYSWLDNMITALSFIFYSMPIFFIALVSMYIFAVNFKGWGLPYLPTVGMFEPEVGKTPAQVAVAHDPAGVEPGTDQYGRLQPLHPQHHAGSDESGLHPHGQVERTATAVHRLCPRAEECLPADRDVDRPGSAAAAGRRGGHRAHLCLAGHGPPVPGPCRARRHGRW